MTDIFEGWIGDPDTKISIIDTAASALELNPVKYQLGKYRGSETVYIEDRGDNRWAITNGDSCLNTDFEWEFEPRPSSRSNEFKDRTRFTFSDAKLVLAEAILRGKVK